MLHNAAPIQPEDIRNGQWRLGEHLEVDQADVGIKSLMQDLPFHTGDQLAEEGDGDVTALGGVGAVVDIVWGDVGQEGIGGILLDVELVEEVEEDGVLLGRADGLGGAVGARRNVVLLMAEVVGSRDD